LLRIVGTVNDRPGAAARSSPRRQANTFQPSAASSASRLNPGGGTLGGGQSEVGKAPRLADRHVVRLGDLTPHGVGEAPRFGTGRGGAPAVDDKRQGGRRDGNRFVIGGGYRACSGLAAASLF
jgi:hypothetical protein